MNTIPPGLARSESPDLAIVMPALDEAAMIDIALSRLQMLRSLGVRLVVADGGSSDGTAQRARQWADEVIVAARGRAVQMNAGAARVGTAAEVLLFLHADTRLPADAADRIAAARAGGARWGRFDVRIDGRSRWLGVVARLMNLRSRLTGICTGDQAIFVEREFFEQLGGFADLPLMEDIEFSRRARKVAWPMAITVPVTTSGRRWEQRGVWRTILLMWSLRWRFYRGEDPAMLARHYRAVR